MKIPPKKKVNGRKKGNNYENKIGSILRTWALDKFAPNEDPKDWFCRAPLSGAWNRTHAPGEDLIVPKWFPFAIECKNRQKWSFPQLLKGEGPVIQWIKKIEATIEGPTLLIFTKNYDINWVMLRQEHYDQYIGGPFPSNHALLKVAPLEGGYFVLAPFGELIKKWTTISRARQEKG
jgi:hypothetical protein